MSELVRVENLVKEFPLRRGFRALVSGDGGGTAVHAVDDVSLHIDRAEVLGLAGESGSGKSTTGRLILRLLDPTSGTVRYDGRDITTLGPKELIPFRTRMQVVFQDPDSSLSPRMRVGDAIGHPLIIHRIAEGKRARAIVLSLMERIGLSPADFLYRKYPHQLSGGQLQRVVLARALITNPEFLVADEPIAMADVSVRAMILELMKELKQEFNLTYLFITHDLATAKYLCDRVAIMYLGRIVEIGTRDAIFKQPHHPYTKALLSAVPAPDPSKRRTEPIPKGEIPSAISPPSGCHFHPRCVYAKDACRVGRPPLKQLSPGHFSACILE
ncbi:MAG TPA: ABC transporter ATP-binding protein [Spirochaetia bacterium]|nr:ABC transporter ATP-binding protein [Spirochaetia bacterium]